MPPMVLDAADDGVAPMRVLVVDDDPDVNRLLRARLRAGGHDVVGVASGEEALARFDEIRPDVLVLDIAMPGLSGLEVLARVRDAERDLAVIICTAFGSEQVAIEALRRGADDYLRKPFDSAEFQAVLARTIAKLRLRRRYAALHRQAEAQRTQLEAELTRAGEVQAGLLPRTPPDIPGFELAARCVPTRDVGGDFFDWQTHPAGTLSLSLGDVMGKGMPAALLMATVRAAIRAVAPYHAPALAVGAVERALAGDFERAGSFVTLFHGWLDPVARRLAFVDAGHGHAFLRRVDGTVEALAPRGLPLGVLPGEGHPQGMVTFLPGDALVLYSDGPASNSAATGSLDQSALGACLGYARTAAAMLDCLLPPKPIAPPEDDLTVLVLRCGADV